MNLIINNVIVICPIDSSIIYSLSSDIYIYIYIYIYIIYRYIYIYIWCPYYNTRCPYSDMGTEYGHTRYLWN